MSDSRTEIAKSAVAAAAASLSSLPNPSMPSSDSSPGPDDVEEFVEAEESVKPIKMYQEIDVFIRLLRQHGTKILPKSFDPFAEYKEKADNKGAVKKFLHNTGVRYGITVIKVASDDMIASYGQDPLYEDVRAFILSHGLAEDEESMKEELIRDFSKAVLEAFEYMFLKTAALGDKKKKNVLYEYFRILCAHMATGEKWKKKGRSWFEFFSTTYGREFTRLMRSLQIKLQAMIRANNQDLRPGEFQENVNKLKEVTGNLHLLLRKTIHKLSSSYEPPEDLFSNLLVIEAFSGDNNYEYFAGSKIIGEIYKDAIPDKETYEFYRKIYFDADQAEATSRSDKLAEEKVNISTQRSSAEAGYYFPSPAINPSLSASSASSLATIEQKEQKYFSNSLVPFRAPSAQLQVSQLAPHIEATRHKQEELEKEIDALAKKYKASVLNRAKGFLDRLIEILPKPLKEALKSTASDKVSTVKKYRAQVFIGLIFRLSDIFRRLTNVNSILANLSDVVLGASNLSKWVLYDDLNHVCRELLEITSESNSIYLQFLEKAYFLVSEIPELEGTPWERNVSNALNAIANPSGLLELNAKAEELVKAIANSIQLSSLHEDALRIEVSKEKIRVKKKVFYNIDSPETVFDRFLHTLQTTTLIAASLQQVRLQYAQQGQGIYFQQALTSNVGSKTLALTLPSNAQVSILPEIITGKELGDAIHPLAFHQNLDSAMVLTGEIFYTGDQALVRVGQAEYPLDKEAVELIERHQAAIKKTGAALAQVGGQLSRSKASPLPLQPALGSAAVIEAASVVSFMEPHITVVDDSEASSQASVEDSPAADDLAEEKHAPLVATVSPDIAATQKIGALLKEQETLESRCQEIKTTLLPQVDRSHDLTSEILKPRWWWATGLGFVLALPFILAAGVYRWWKRSEREEDKRQFDALTREIGEKEVRKNSIATELGEQTQGIKSRTTEREQQAAEAARKKREAVEARKKQQEDEVRRNAALTTSSPSRTSSAMFSLRNPNRGEEKSEPRLIGCDIESTSDFVAACAAELFENVSEEATLALRSSIDKVTKLKSGQSHETAQSAHNALVEVYFLEALNKVSRVTDGRAIKNVQLCQKIFMAAWQILMSPPSQTPAPR